MSMKKIIKTYMTVSHVKNPNELNPFSVFSKSSIF